MTINNTDIQIRKRLISAMANKLTSEGYQVWADHIGYPNGKPDEFNKHIPDIYAQKNGEKVIIEATDCVPLTPDLLEEIRLRWIALSAIKDVNFSVIIPKRCVPKIKDLATKWGVVVKNYWNMDI